jgi:hypothetical protein
MTVIPTIIPAFQIGARNDFALDVGSSLVGLEPLLAVGIPVEGVAADACSSLVGFELLLAVGIPVEGVAAGALTETVCARIQVIIAHSM